MKRCLITNKAPIPRRPCPHRLYSTPSTTTTDASSGPAVAPNGDPRSYKHRKWGSRPLPLSPIMDPVKIEQRNRYKQPKLPAPKNADLTPFQKALVNNPYARALASDVRLCKITAARLPSFFQIPFEILPHPEPPHPLCVVPSRLFAELTPEVAAKSTKHGAASYAQARRSVLRFVTGAKRVGVLVNEYQRDTIGLVKRKNLVWREDMDEFVLGLLQNAVVRALRWGFQHPKAGLLARCDEGASVMESIDGVACLLYKNTIESHLDLEAKVDKLVNECRFFYDRVVNLEATGKRLRGTSQEHTLMQRPPALNIAYSHPQEPNPSAPYKDRIVPVYSLMDMLGEEKVGELLSNTAFEDAQAIVLKEGNLTANAQMALLRLQEYLS